MSEVYVLDACALIALTNQEKGADVVLNVIRQAYHGKVRIFMNRVNLYEVYYGFYREYGRDYALNVVKNVEKSPVLITDFSRDVFLEAGRLKSTYRLSLADSVAIAQTIILNGFMPTSDHHEFDSIDGKENLVFSWIR